MTSDELKAHIGTFVQLGDVLKIFLPGEWDDRIVDYLKAFYASDVLLTLLAEDLSRIMPAYADDDAVVSLPAKDGTTQELGPGSIFLFIKLAMMILELLKKRNSNGNP